jgi:hypothetical protein
LVHKFFGKSLVIGTNSVIGCWYELTLRLYIPALNLQ